MGGDLDGYTNSVLRPDVKVAAAARASKAELARAAAKETAEGRPGLRFDELPDIDEVRKLDGRRAPTAGVLQDASGSKSIPVRSRADERPGNGDIDLAGDYRSEYARDRTKGKSDELRSTLHKVMSHAEGQAVAAMKKSGIRHGVLDINNNHICDHCLGNLVTAIPKGGTLTVRFIDESGQVVPKVFKGAGNMGPWWE